MTLHDHIYSNFNISISFKPSITFAGSTGNLGSVRGRSLKAGRIRRLWRQQCLVSSFFLILPAQPQDLDSYSFLLYPAGAAAGYCFLLVSSSFFLPCRRTGRVLYLTRFFFLLLLLSSSSFFFFFLLATHLFHTLPYIWFWPNLLTVTGTLTTTHTLKMVGSGVTMGSLGSKRSFSPKTHQVLQIT